MSDPKLDESSAPKFTHPRGSRDAYVAAFGVVALLGLFSYLAFLRGSPEAGRSSERGVHVDSVQSFGDGAKAEACAPSGSPCQKLASGANVPAGSRLKTDYRTELAVTLRGSTHLVLGRNSELALSKKATEGARLQRGTLSAELDVDGSNFLLALPHGSLSAARAKFAVHVESDATRVEVSRGNVRVENVDGHASPVHAGEVARFSKTSFGVEAAKVMASALAFDEDAETPTERRSQGLGELSARKPGTREELGGAVHLVSHSVKVRIAGLMARTEVEEVFENRTAQQLEGIYRFPIPPNAQIEQLSLEVNGKWEDGAFVDRDRASAIWNGAIVHANPAARPLVDDIVWVPGPWRDPALLEWQRGGRFELRIFPIPARGERRVKLRYSEVVPALAELRRYEYPLASPAGSEAIRQFDVDVELRGHEPSNSVNVTGYPLEARSQGSALHYAYSVRNFMPTGALGVEYELPSAASELRGYAYLPERREVGTPRPLGISNEDAYVAIALRPRLPMSSEKRPRSLAIVVDSSHSMLGESFSRAKRLAARLVRELDTEDRVTMLACDSSCEHVRESLDPGRRGEAAARRFLDTVQPGGASDPTRALTAGLRAARDSSDRDVRIVYIGDGTPTMGPIRPSHVEAEVRRELPADGARVTAVAVGPEADSETLSALARGGGGVVVRYQPGQSVGQAAMAVLGASSGRALRDVEVSLPDGLYAVAPTRLDAIPAGGESFVLARMRGNEVSGELTLRGRIGADNFERRYPLKLSASSSAAAAFVPRLYAAARIVELERDGAEDKKREAIELSTRFSVASRYTSLLVLESQAMFDAFGLKTAQSVGEWSADEVADAATASADGDDEQVAASQSVEPAEKKSANNPYSDDGSGRLGSGSGASSDMASGRAAPAPAPAPRKMRAKAEEYERSEGAPSALAKPAAPAFARPPADALEPDPVFEMRRNPLPAPERPRIPMRRIWERKGEIATNRTTPKAASFDAIEQAERRSLNEPDRREPLKKLYSLLALASELGRAERVAERWSERDPLDADALTARADLAARRGDREGAIRVLGSVVDARPSDVALQRRLERLERWSGNAALGCRHLVAAAELKQSDAKLLADAVRCSRGQADDLAARELLAGVAESLQKRVAEELAKPALDDSSSNGDLQIQARFDGSEDLDISLIDPDGQRVSWLGAPTRAVIAARDVVSRERESLSLRGAKAGEYVVEVVRARRSGPSVRGELDIRVAGSSARVPFTLSGTRVAVALVTVKMVPRLVPLERPRFPVSSLR